LATSVVATRVPTCERHGRFHQPTPDPPALPVVGDGDRHLVGAWTERLDAQMPDDRRSLPA